MVRRMECWLVPHLILRKDPVAEMATGACWDTLLSRLSESGVRLLGHRYSIESTHSSMRRWLTSHSNFQAVFHLSNFFASKGRTAILPNLFSTAVLMPFNVCNTNS